MRQHILIALTLFLVLTAGSTCHLTAEPVRLLAWEASTESRCTADLAEELPRGLDEAVELIGIETELELIPREDLRMRLTTLGFEENLPDLVWVPENRIGDLADSRLFLPLNELLAERPWLLDGLSGEALEGFTVEGGLFALPLDADGELAGIGLALTRAAAERGRLDQAVELAGFLKERLPLRPTPDLMAMLTLDRDELLEGEPALMISEIVNTGDEMSDGVPLQFCIDGEPVAEMWVEPLEPGQHTTVEANIDLPPAGEHLFSGRLDTSSMVQEANRNNDSGEMGQMIHPMNGPTPPAPKPLTSPITLRGAAFHTRVDSQRHVRVAFDGTNFLVAWFIDFPLFNTTGKRKIIGTRVSPSGTILDPAGIHITTIHDRFQSFDLAFDGQRFLVVWERLIANPFASSVTVPNPYSKIEGVRVSKAGTVLDTTPILVEGQPCGGCPVNYNAFQYTAPQVASTNNGFLVVYRRRYAGGMQKEDCILGKFVNGGGVVKPGRKNLMTLGITCQPTEGQSLAFNAARGEGIIVFDSYNNNDPTIFKQQITAVWLKLNGTNLVASPPKQAITVTTKLWERLDRPEVAAAPDGTFFAAYESDVGKGNNSWPDIHGIHFGPFTTRTVNNVGTVVKGSLEMQPALDWDGHNYGMAFAHGTCSPVPGFTRVSSAGGSGTKVIPWKNLGRLNDLDIAFGAGKGLVVYAREFSGQNNPSKYKYKIEAFFVKATH